MIPSRDVFAETNPAFYCAVFSQFCSFYKQEQSLQRPPEMPLVYLIVPLAISEDLASTFEGCNKDTGLPVWLNRSPKITTDLAKKVNSTLELTTAAMRFGCLAGLLRITPDGYLESAKKTLPATVSGGVASAALKRARLLGIWMSTMGSSRAVLESLGVSV